MPRTYANLMKEIEALQAEAQALKRKEVDEVIGRIRDAIAVYGLTPRDLFGSAARGGARRGAGKASGGAARYRDGAGNVWGGRGPRPQWLRDALAAGKQLSDFEVKGRSAGNGVVRKATPKRGKKRGGVVKYRDDAGNTWSGFGPKPAWFKQALADGKTPDDLRG